MHAVQRTPPVLLGGPTLDAEHLDSSRPTTHVGNAGSLQDADAFSRGLNRAPNESGIGGRPRMGDYQPVPGGYGSAASSLAL